MVAVFEQAAAQRRGRGAACVVLFFVKEMAGLVAGAARERVSHDDAIPVHDDLPFPSDVAEAERSLEVVSRRLINAIAKHDFANARYYDQLDRSYAPYSPSCARSRVDGAGGGDYQENKG